MVHQGLIENVRNVFNYTSNADDRVKANILLKKIKKNKVKDEDCILFLSLIDQESLHIPLCV